MDRCSTATVDPTEALQRLSTTKQLDRESVEEYNFKLVSLFNKAFVVGHDRGREMEKNLLSIFRRGLHSIHVQIQIIRQEPANLEDAAQIAMSETSILSEVKCESSHTRRWKSITIGKGLIYKLINRHRDQVYPDLCVYLYRI